MHACRVACLSLVEIKIYGSGPRFGKEINCRTVSWLAMLLLLLPLSSSFLPQYLIPCRFEVLRVLFIYSYLTINQQDASKDHLEDNKILFISVKFLGSYAIFKNSSSAMSDFFVLKESASGDIEAYKTSVFAYL